MRNEIKTKLNFPLPKILFAHLSATQSLPRKKCGNVAWSGFTAPLVISIHLGFTPQYNKVVTYISTKNLDKLRDPMFMLPFSQGPLLKKEFENDLTESDI